MLKRIIACLSLLLAAWSASSYANEPSYCAQSGCSAEFLAQLKKAEAGDPQAQNHVGEMLHFGDGVSPDFVAARSWYLKAVASGDAIAPNHLGRLYLNGEGVPRDETEACKWYKVAARRGDKAGQHNYATCARKS